MAILTLSANLHASYDPEIGRFLQRDSLGTKPMVAFTGGSPKFLFTQGPAVPNPDPTVDLSQYIDGMNLYEYVKNNPIMLTDPTGGCEQRNVPNTGKRNTIHCQNGELVVHLGAPTGCKPNDECTQEHEEQHMEDWIKFYGKDLCKGVKDGNLPVGGDGYEEMFNKSECDAYTKGLECREDALKKCPSQNDRSILESGIERDKKMIKKYCD